MSRKEVALPPPRQDDASYYGRPILKAPAWDWRIPAYLFAGGLSGRSTLLSVGADLTGRPRLRKRARLAAVVGLGASTYFLVSDLGRPLRFHHMLRVAKPTSPMSMGTWIIAAYSPGIGLAAVGELLPARWPVTRLVRWLSRPASLSSAALAPALASYTAVLLSQTAVPAWNTAHPTCRPCSPARPRRAPGGWRWSWRRRRRRARPACSPGSARRPSSWRRG